jgi:hypothetical protein
VKPWIYIIPFAFEFAQQLTIYSALSQSKSPQYSVDRSAADGGNGNEINGRAFCMQFNEFRKRIITP